MDVTPKEPATAAATTQIKTTSKDRSVTPPRHPVAVTPHVPVSTRRINAGAKLLVGDPEDALRVLNRLDDDELSNIAEVIKQLQTERAMARGDLDAIIVNAFESGFGRDGLGVNPWIEGNVIVCPGGIISKSRSTHRCRFISVNDTWIWDSGELIREDKRSLPGAESGFRAVALLPVLNGMALDVVNGKARGGQHSVDRVTSYVVKRGQLHEVSQRRVTEAGMQ